MRRLVLQKVYLLRPLLLLRQLPVLYLPLRQLLLLLQLLRFLVQQLLPLLQLRYLHLQLRRSLLRLQLLPHRKGQGTIIQGLICVNCHIELISDSHKQNASFRGVYGDLSDNLIEALSVEFFPDGADA